MKRVCLWVWVLWETAAAWGRLAAAPPGEQVVVVYNRNLPESREVAKYYARLRQVPSAQVFGFDLPGPDTLSRQDYRARLEQPLLTRLEAGGLLEFDLGAPAAAEAARTPHLGPTRARIRYAVLCYGVPYIIDEDTNVVEQAAERWAPKLRKNEAAVDSELACLPWAKRNYPLTGFISNPAYLATNTVPLHPTNGVLMVARLDGPSAAIARGLVDKAMQAETNGLWGRAYFDARGLTNGPFLLGDEWIRNGARASRHLGFDTYLDLNPATLPASFPLSQVALYAGWYDWQVSGPFAREQVEFMPGAFAYHLHSFSARYPRDPAHHWVGPLLRKGATATMGCVLEPFLDFTPNVGAFVGRFLQGFTFGESAYASQPVLSWQTTVIGDPLYRPFGRGWADLREDLRRRGSPLVEWADLRQVLLKEVSGASPAESIESLEKLPELASSAVLNEMLGRLRYAAGRKEQAIEAYRRALALDPSPQLKTRLMLVLSLWLAGLERDAEAVALLRQFQVAFPDYPDPASIWQRLRPLAQKLGDTPLVDRCDRELSLLQAR